MFNQITTFMEGNHKNSNTLREVANAMRDKDCSNKKAFNSVNFVYKKLRANNLSRCNEIKDEWIRFKSNIESFSNPEYGYAIDIINDFIMNLSDDTDAEQSIGDDILAALEFAVDLATVHFAKVMKIDNDGLDEEYVNYCTAMYVEIQLAKTSRPEVQLSGRDGNALSLVGAVSKSLRRNGEKHLLEIFKREALAGDYNHVIRTCMKYANVT